jgi:NOL1/NOP2/fmu family ribosome biogenesis protein
VQTTIPIPLKDEWGIVTSSMDGITGYRFYPHRISGEGLFMCMLKKPGTRPSRNGGNDRKRPELRFEHVLADRPLHHTEQNGVQHVVDERWGAEVEHLQRVLRTLAPGIPVAERKGSGWKPHPALATSHLLDLKTVESTELELDQAIAYLKGHALPATDAKGAALAMYKGHPLGWLHGAGNRWNNRYPLAWRIRSHQAAASAVPWNS